MRGFAYRPCEELSETAHVMVDGRPTRSSVATLSHWPASTTPRFLARDLSTEICYSFIELADGRWRPGVRSRRPARLLVAEATSAGVATCDHFDGDGLLGLFVLTESDRALAAEQLVVAAARCDDFGVIAFEEAAMVAFSLGGLADKEAGRGASASDRLAAVLPRVDHLLSSPSSYTPYFEEELAAARTGKEAIASGSVRLVEENNLVVVTRMAPDGHRLLGARGGLPIHESAVHSATDAVAVLAFDGDRCELYFRYEGWVRVVSREIPRRCDLAPLASELSSLEGGRIVWEASAPAALVPRLAPVGEGRTELDPEVVRERVSSYLARAPAAFDPWRTA